MPDRSVICSGGGASATQAAAAKASSGTKARKEINFIMDLAPLVIPRPVSDTRFFAFLRFYFWVPVPLTVKLLDFPHQSLTSLEGGVVGVFFT